MNQLLRAGRVPGAQQAGTDKRSPWVVPANITRAACGLREKT